METTTIPSRKGGLWTVKVYPHLSEQQYLSISTPCIKWSHDGFTSAGHAIGYLKREAKKAGWDATEAWHILPWEGRFDIFLEREVR